MIIGGLVLTVTIVIILSINLSQGYQFTIIAFIIVVTGFIVYWIVEYNQEYFIRKNTNLTIIDNKIMSYTDKVLEYLKKSKLGKLIIKHTNILLESKAWFLTKTFYKRQKINALYFLDVGKYHILVCIDYFKPYVIRYRTRVATTVSGPLTSAQQDTERLYKSFVLFGFMTKMGVRVLYNIEIFREFVNRKIDGSIRKINGSIGTINLLINNVNSSIYSTIRFGTNTILYIPRTSYNFSKNIFNVLLKSFL